MTGMAATDYERHAREWIAAWNAHDLDRILGYYADDVELVSPFVVRLTGRVDGVVRGKAALREYFARGLEAYPDLKFRYRDVYPGVASCVLEYESVRRLPAAELMEFDASGRIRRVVAHYGEPRD